MDLDPRHVTGGLAHGARRKVMLPLIELVGNSVCHDGMYPGIKQQDLSRTSRGRISVLDRLHRIRDLLLCPKDRPCNASLGSADAFTNLLPCRNNLFHNKTSGHAFFAYYYIIHTFDRFVNRFFRLLTFGSYLYSMMKSRKERK